jgi:flagellar basal body-associated protein FliL
MELKVAKTQSVTSLDISPEEERKSRMIKYTIAMSVRVVCIVLAVMVQGWLMWLLFAGAIFLPYFAVVIANAQGATQTSKAAKAVAPTITISADAFTAASQTKPKDDR